MKGFRSPPPLIGIRHEDSRGQLGLVVSVENSSYLKLVSFSLSFELNTLSRIQTYLIDKFLEQENIQRGDHIFDGLSNHLMRIEGPKNVKKFLNFSHLSIKAPVCQ